MDGYKIAAEKASLGCGPMVWRLLVALATALLLLPHDGLCVPVEKTESKHSEMIKGKRFSWLLVGLLRVPLACVWLM
ncbi:hypothetical protein V9T40_006413 [Parthenolecanium corni]|uniref:Uncharacterized protein n=1 Tax=Parthenolecanium corni TaxID=536013 RepID=A0AAN9TKR3_9HEMI